MQSAQRHRPSALLSGAALLLALLPSGAANARSAKILLCHEGKNISVAESAVEGHLRHHAGNRHPPKRPGDRLGPCENTPPTRPGVSLRQQVVPFAADLVCEITAPAMDAEGDPIRYAFDWSLDGVPHRATATTVHPGDTVPAEHLGHGTWTCRVRASDGWVAGPAATASTRAALDRNVLVIVADDVGVNFVGAYAYGTSTPVTPNIDALAAQGVLFRNGYAQPACSPTRAASLTGRFVRRYGVGAGIPSSRFPAYDLPLDEETIPELLRHSPWSYDTAAIGKWHLGHSLVSPLTNPLEQGFGFHLGSWANLGSYESWPHVDNGSWFTETRYPTSASVDEALTRIREMPQPWFMWLAFNAAHEPLHVPPDHLHGQAVDEHSSDPELYRAVVEALDTEVGRLLASMDPVVRSETTIVFIGDNGTYKSAIDYPLRPAGAAKGTLYEQGIHVPWIVVSPHVSQPGTETQALVHVVDLLPTVAEIADVDLGDRVIDGVSFLSVLEDPASPGLRDYVVVEKMRPLGPPPWTQSHQIAVRNARFKLWQDKLHGVTKLFDLQGAPYDDGPNLLQRPLSAVESAAFSELALELFRYDQSVTFDY